MCNIFKTCNWYLKEGVRDIGKGASKPEKVCMSEHTDKALLQRITEESNEGDFLDSRSHPDFEHSGWGKGKS